MPRSNSSTSARVLRTDNKNTIPAECLPVAAYAVWLHLLCSVEAWYEHEILFKQDDAKLLAELFGTSEELWLNLHHSFSEWRKIQTPERLSQIAESISLDDKCGKS